MNCQAIIAGIGGQGVLFAARIFTELARQRGLPVLGSQTFGMAQRGGSVMTHIKIGAFDGPLVNDGDADLLLALDSIEGHRRLSYLRGRRGDVPAVCVVNAASPAAFPDPLVAPVLSELGASVHVCAADAEAMAINAPLAANLVLLGFGASRGDFPFSYDEVRAATTAISGDKHLASNLAALERGRQL